MIPELGQFALILALLVALVQAVVPLIGAHRRDVALMGLAKPAARLQFALVALAFGCLAFSFATSDFSVINVAEHSNTQLPLHYRIAGHMGLARRLAAPVGTDADRLGYRSDAALAQPAGRAAGARARGDGTRFRRLSSVPAVHLQPVPAPGTRSG